MRTNLTLTLGLLATAILPATVLAQDDDMGRRNLSGDAPGAEQGLHGRLGFGFTSQYFFRGIRQERSGLITQPWIKLNYDLVDSDEGLRDLKLVFGQWNSLHSGRTGPGGGIWYESRFWVGLEGQIGDRFHVGARFNAYANPNGFGGLTNIEELQFDARFNDHGVFVEDLALNPYATLAFELNNERDTGVGVAGSNEGIYFETGVSPSIELGEFGESSLTLSVPTKLGFSFGDYYERPTGGGDDFFGFFQTGGVVSAPLDFMPSRLGPWEAHAGLHLIVLGDNNDALNGGDSAELFFEFGMSTTF